MDSGWIRIKRDITEHFLWQDKPFAKGQAWIDLLLMANHKETKKLLGSDVESIQRGSFITSESALMQRWGWSKSKVRGYLKLLEDEHMIEKKATSKWTVITIVSYEVYQDLQTTEEPQKNYKQRSNQIIYTCAFEQFWEAYPRKKDKGLAFKRFNARLKSGFSETELLQAAIKYADECKKNHTEERYIKHAATFLGDATPFVDYLEQKGENDNETRISFKL